MSTSAACRYCGGPVVPHTSGRDYNRRTDARRFHLVRCVGCGLIDLADPPADLGRYYGRDYYFLADSVPDLDKHIGEHRYKIDYLRRFKTGGELLEIGPAIGMFAKLARDDGFTVSAIEMDAECCRFLNDKLGVRALCSDDPAAALAADGKTYDAICLWHALEHLSEPWRVIAASAASLKPDGVMVVAVPNPEARQIRWMGRFWPHHDLPRHLVHMPMAWLSARAAEAGLEMIEMTTRDEGSRFFSRFSYARLLMNLAPHPRLEPLLYGAGLRLGRLLGFLDAAEGQGATYTAAFRKRA
jgi:2-polyprenyl-3-methyl-5-hydroxy-6-metoxy-1,4-benzoquinol methylase